MKARAIESRKSLEPPRTASSSSKFTVMIPPDADAPDGPLRQTEPVSEIKRLGDLCAQHLLSHLHLNFKVPMQAAVVYLDTVCSEPDDVVSNPPGIYHNFFSMLRTFICEEPEDKINTWKVSSFIL